MKLLRHESVMLDCFLRALCAETLASRWMENQLLKEVFDYLKFILLSLTLQICL